MTHKELTLNHLKKYGSITSLEAINFYGNTRLSDTIYRLRHDGNNIVSKIVPVKNRFGKKCYVSRYELENNC